MNVQGVVEQARFVYRERTFRVLRGDSEVPVAAVTRLGEIELGPGSGASDDALAAGAYEEAGLSQAEVVQLRGLLLRRLSQAEARALARWLWSKVR